MGSVGQIKKLLGELCPDLEVDRIEKLGEGDFCEVYLVNGSLDADEQGFVVAQLDQASVEASDFVLLHGDLSPDHVMYNPDSRSVTGIIDFGDLMIGDPAWDLVYLYEDYGIEFLSMAIHAYLPAEPMSQVLSRMYRWYLVDLIEWVAETAEEEHDEFPDAHDALTRTHLECEERLRELTDLHC